ncbi:hypothetical protein [Collimonas humicola]|uniref:hypothetical protein n=1 Tax=Collimonas humicola TaxID=2825886 RepID=UPI001B8D138B|nr:hypothetical protein [Collimonas humicola]
MATNLTKGKTTKTAATVATVKASTAETVATIAKALKPSTLDAVVDALTAAVGKAAAPAAEPAPARRATPATPLHKFPVMPDAVFGGDLLLTNVMQAKALGRCPVVREQVVMSHDQYGVICLRAVEYNDGYLIGLIDGDKATYCECEFFASEKDMALSWPQWLDAAAM